MSTHTATATREGTWWVVDCGEYGATQARSLTEAREMATDLIAVVLDVPAEDVDVDLTISLADELQTDVTAAKALVDILDRVQRETANRSRVAARNLRDSGLSGRDIAVILGVTPQRVSQLIGDDRAAGTSQFWPILGKILLTVMEVDQLRRDSDRLDEHLRKMGLDDEASDRFRKMIA
jgi:predicted transcriptional regulator